MKKIGAYLALLSALLLVPLPVQADCRRVVFRHHAPVVHHKAAVVVEKIVTPVVAYFPLYSAVHIPGYHPGGVVPPPAGVSANNEAVPAWAQEMLAGFRLLKDGQLQLNERVRRIEDRIGVPQGPPPQPMPGAGNGEVQGPQRPPDPFRPPVGAGGYKLAQLTPESAGKVVDEVLSGRMPKGKQFSDADKVAFLRDLSSGDDAKVLARMVTSCASCHDKAVAAAKGKGFVLTEK